MYENTHKNNFDFLRVFLAFLVMISHMFILSGNDEWKVSADFFDLVSEIAVDSFFIVSGFLIFMSFERSTSIKSYALKRLQRIYPAYIVVVLFTAIILVAVSSKSIGEYFSLEWFKYLISNGLFLNFLHNWLPGVFEDNTLQTVNGALWTIKIEVMFYISVPFLILFVLRKYKFFGLIGIYLFSVVYSVVCFYFAQDDTQSIYILLQRQLPGQLAFFISGAFLYYYYEHFKRYVVMYLFFAAIGLSISSFFDYSPLLPISLAIWVIYFATSSIYLGNWGKYGDFSYGIYIWHFPVIQTFVTLGMFTSMPIIAEFIVVLLVLFCAYLSWNFVEKPFLRKKSHYKTAEY